MPVVDRYMREIANHKSVWFWQRIISPHMAELVSALAEYGVDTTYVAERVISPERAAQGWGTPDLGDAQLRLAPDKETAAKLAAEAPADSIHICQGLRGNGYVSEVQKVLARRGVSQWVVMETVEDNGLRGLLRRLAYRRLVKQRSKDLVGYLATGHATSDWLAARGADPQRIFPFAYFLADEIKSSIPTFDPQKPFRFLFVGRFVELKKLDLLIDALAALELHEVELAVIGSGPMEDALRTLAINRLGDHVIWLGKQPHVSIPDHMAGADCLVLPSRYDGWGAVVSEALMAGTPAICSDGCGAADVVRSSGIGGVFPVGDVKRLTSLLRQVVSAGRQTPVKRTVLSEWGRCLGAEAGAQYLQSILMSVSGAGPKPAAPWEVNR